MFAVILLLACSSASSADTSTSSTCVDVSPMFAPSCGHVELCTDVAGDDELEHGGYVVACDRDDCTRAALELARWFGCSS